jgi:hypothetical protein
MVEAIFPEFQQTFPPTGERVPYDPSRHDAFAAKVPAILAEEWRARGFGAYGEGILWIPDPGAPFLDPGDWPAVEEASVEVLRTAFGHVCLWQGGKFLWLNVYSGNAVSYGSDAEAVFYSAKTKDFLKNVLHERLFQLANKRLGKLGAEECFGFAPLPALGGAIAAEYLIKTKMREYVSLAAQVLG